MSSYTPPSAAERRKQGYYDFSKKPNTHPVHYTGAVPANIKKGLVNPEAESRHLEQRITSWDRLKQHVTPEPLLLPPPAESQLPSYWSKAQPIPPEKLVKFHRQYWIILSSASLARGDRFEVLEDSKAPSQRSHFIGWSFLNRAICSPHHGTKDPRCKNTPWLFPIEHEDGTATFHPKVRVFLELLFRDYRGMVRTTILKDPALCNKPLAEIDLNAVITDVMFREMMTDRRNFIGVRIRLLVFDPLWNLAFNLQSELARNKIMWGLASPLEIFHAERKRYEQKNAKDSANEDLDQESVALLKGAGVNLSEGGKKKHSTAATKGKTKSTKKAKLQPIIPGKDGNPAKQQQVPDQDSGSNDDEAEEEPEDEQEVRDRELKHAYNFVQRMCGGLKHLNYTDCDEKLPLLNIRDRYRKFRSMNQEALKNGKTPKPTSFDDVQKLVVRSELIEGLTKHKDAHCSMITDAAKVVQYVYGGVGMSKSLYDEGKRLGNTDKIDLADPDSRFHPRHVFNFTATIAEIFKNPQLRPCVEQLCEANYTHPQTGEAIFPIPGAVYEIGLADLKLKEGRKAASAYSKKKAPWAFLPMEEHMLRVQREADRRERESLRNLQEQNERMKTDPNTAFDRTREQAWNDCDARQLQIEHSRRYTELHCTEALFEQQMSFLAELNDEIDEKGFVARVGPSRDQDAEGSNASADKLVIEDVMNIEAKRAKDKEEIISTLESKVPDYAMGLRKAFRKDQLQRLYELLKPGATGVNEIHKLHNEALYQHDLKKVHTSYSGYENLTAFSGMVAQWVTKTREQIGLTNSHHVFLTTMFCVNTNCYRTDRLIAFHCMKIGAPGSSKSWMDAFIKACKVAGTVVEAIHSSNMAKLAATHSQCDRFYMQDEANSSLLGDTSKAKSSSEMSAITLTKASLSNEYLTYMYYYAGGDGQGARQVRKIIASRSCQSTNSNILPDQRDTSVYDRYIIWVIAPWFAPNSLENQMFRDLKLSEDAKGTKAEACREIQRFDSLMFRACKMVDVKAAAEPCINDFTLTLSKGFAKFSKTGLMSNLTRRDVTRCTEIAICLTICNAVMKVYSGPFSPVIHEAHVEKILKRFVSDWNDEYLKYLPPYMFMTEDVKVLALSIAWRMCIGDYAPWISINYLARGVCGMTDAFFDDLFDREAWRDHETKVQADGKTPKRVKKFGFFHPSDIFKNPERAKLGAEAIPSYVAEADLLNRRFERIGLTYRKSLAPGSNETDPRMTPFFYTLQKSVRELDQEPLEYTDQQNRYVNNRYRSERQSSAVSSLDNPSDRRQYNAAFMGNRSLQEKLVAMGYPVATPLARDGEYEKGYRLEIDPNWVVVPGGYQVAGKIEYEALKHNSAKSELLTDNILRKLGHNNVMVPRLKKMSAYNQALEFEMQEDGKGGKQIVMQSVPICKEESINGVLYDPISKQHYSRQKVLMISTMALYTFHPTRALFQLLTALEYEFTPVMTSITDISILGREGIFHTHTSYPNFTKRLRKSTSQDFVQTVYRTILADQLPENWTDFVKPALTPEQERALLADPFAMDYQPTSASRNAPTPKVPDQESVEGGKKGKKSKKSKKKEETEGEFLRRELVEELTKEAARKEALEGTRIDQAIPNYHESMHRVTQRLTPEEQERRRLAYAQARALAPEKNGAAAAYLQKLTARRDGDSEFYEVYHIEEEFERWMRQKHGKEMIEYDASGMIVKDRRKKPYYPGRYDEMIKQCVDLSPQFNHLQMAYGGKRERYPWQYLSEVRDRDKGLVKTKNNDPCMQVFQPAEVCEAVIKDYLARLREYRKNEKRSPAEVTQKRRVQHQPDADDASMESTSRGRDEDSISEIIRQADRKKQKTIDVPSFPPASPAFSTSSATISPSFLGGATARVKITSLPSLPVSKQRSNKLPPSENSNNSVGSSILGAEDSRGLFGLMAGAGKLRQSSSSSATASSSEEDLIRNRLKLDEAGAAMYQTKNNKVPESDQDASASSASTSKKKKDKNKEKNNLSKKEVKAAFQ